MNIPHSPIARLALALTLSASLSLGAGRVLAEVECQDPVASWKPREVLRKLLEDKVMSISEEEQSRIRRDIHDDLCQQLAAIGCLAKVVYQRLTANNSPDAVQLAEITRLITQANVRAREMSRGLVPVRFPDAPPHLSILPRVLVSVLRGTNPQLLRERFRQRLRQQYHCRRRHGNAFSHG
jgi:signal transduction histidine kinase